MPLINFSGIASGIDSSALIEATAEARRKTSVDPHTKRIGELEDTNTALTKLGDKFGNLRTLLQGMSSLQGGALSKIGSSTDETIATATATPAAVNGSYTVTVSQLARNANFSFDDRYPTTGALINSSINNGAAAADRTVSIEVGTGSNLETVNVVLTNTTTPDQFVSEYNSLATKSIATLVNVGTASSPSYAIMVTSTEQGVEKGQIAVSVGTEIQTAGAGAFLANNLQQALDAQFQVSGITGTITRPTNTIADVISGVTFGMQSVGSTTVTIANDTEATKSKVQDFVDQWNEIVGLIAEGNTIEREEDGENVTNNFGPLSATRVDDNALSSLRSVLASSNASSGSAIRIFADLGITTERDGTLKFDEDKFDTAMNEEPNSVNSVLMSFSNTAALSGGTIDQFLRFNGLFDITKNSNTSLITDLNRRIADAEQQIARERENMVARFARLESLMGRLQSQQSALTSALAGLQSN